MRNNFCIRSRVLLFVFWPVEILFYLFRVYGVAELTRNFGAAATRNFFVVVVRFLIVWNAERRNAQRASSNVDLVVFSFTFTLGVELKETLSLSFSSVLLYNFPFVSSFTPFFSLVFQGRRLLKTKQKKVICPKGKWNIFLFYFLKKKERA